jgi:hypothetical protein
MTKIEEKYNFLLENVVSLGAPIGEEESLLDNKSEISTFFPEVSLRIIEKDTVTITNHNLDRSSNHPTRQFYTRIAKWPSLHLRHLIQLRQSLYFCLPSSFFNAMAVER